LANSGGYGREELVDVGDPDRLEKAAAVVVGMHR